MNSPHIECQAALRDGSTGNRIQIRRFYLTRRASADLTRLHKELAEIFVGIPTPFRIYWTDTLGDIVIQTSSELELAFKAMAGQLFNIIVEIGPAGNALNGEKNADYEPQNPPYRRTIKRRMNDLEGEMRKVKEEMKKVKEEMKEVKEEMGQVRKTVEVEMNKHTKAVDELRATLAGLNRGPFPTHEE